MDFDEDDAVKHIKDVATLEKKYCVYIYQRALKPYMCVHKDQKKGCC